MNTMFQARKSARKHGGKPEDYLPIHEWFDETEKWADGKKFLMFRHHAQGIFVAEKKFGVVIENSEGKKIPTRLICEEHITNELGFIPTAQEYLQFMDSQKWMGFRSQKINKAIRKTETV